MTKEEYIEAHIAVCKSKRLSSKGGKRQCAIRHWKWCEHIGVKPVLHFSELPASQQPNSYKVHRLQPK